MSKSYHCSQHNIDHRSYDCPACVREQQHEELIETISKAGKAETPEYTSPPPPHYNCPNCPYGELERDTGFCPDCGTDLKGYWLKREQNEEAARKVAFFLSDYSTYKCPKCSSNTLKYEQKFCSGCGTKIVDQFWSEARAVREPLQRQRAEEDAEAEAVRAGKEARRWWGGFMIFHLIYVLPALVLVSMIVIARMSVAPPDDRVEGAIVIALIPLFNWLAILATKISPYTSGSLGSPYVVHFIPALLVGWAVVGAIVGWAIALRRASPMK